MINNRRWCLVLGGMALVFWISWPGPASAYITVHPGTLGQVVDSSTNIMVVRVEKVSQERGIIIYRKLLDIKGKFPKNLIKHVFGIYDPPENEAGLFKLNTREWNHVLQWAEPGKEAIIMGVHQPAWGHYNHVYVDQCWYGNFCPRGGDLAVWYTIYSRPEMLRNWFCGSVAELTALVKDILAGKEVIAPVMVEGSPDDLRLGRAKVGGLKASTKIRRLDHKVNAAPWSDSKPLVEALIRDLRGQDDLLRLKALGQLQQWFGPELKAAIPVLTDTLVDGNKELRKLAVAALANRSLNAEDVVPTLVGALKNRDRDVRLRALCGLAIRGPAAKVAIPALTLAMNDKDAQVADAAAAALVCINPDLEGKIPAITTALERKASIGGLYRTLLKRIKVTEDLGSQPFQNRAAIVRLSSPMIEYHGHKNLPKGYWVYVYPYWYIWGERADP